MYDILIQNGLVADGSGSAPFRADVAIAGGKIRRIAPAITEPAVRTVDAAGKIVAPGFIDMHSHADTSFLSDARCQSKLYQGVTSELSGQCGDTIYPCPPDRMANIRRFAGRYADYASPSLEAFLNRVHRDGRKMGTNLIPLIGHGALRCGVMGYENRAPSDEEQREMNALLDADMQAGAWGLSLGLGYTPGVSSDVDELAALGGVVGRYGGIVTSHMRHQNGKTPEALAEMCEIGRRGNVHVHVAHFKASGKAAWGSATRFLEIVRGARRDGVNITADVYPYIAASSGITNSFPRWSIQGGKERALEALTGSDRDRLMQELTATFPDAAAAKRLLVVHTNGVFPEADGHTLDEIAEIFGLSPAETLARLALGTKASAPCISFSMCEEDVTYFLSQPDMVIGSDGRALPLSPEENSGKPHPRNFGTFPRFLRFAREHGIPVEEAVHRMTGLTASYIGLTDRGLLKEDLAADVTVFDWEKVRDNAVFTNPFLPNEGVDCVIVNGRIAIENGVQTDEYAGEFLLRGKQA